MVIVIPSVKRPAVDYLNNTLESIFGAMYPVNEDDVAVVVFLAETDDELLKVKCSTFALIQIRVASLVPSKLTHHYVSLFLLCKCFCVRAFRVSTIC